MKTRILYFTLIFFSVIAFSCDRDKEDITTEESQVLLENMSADVEQNLNDIYNSEGVESLTVLSNLDLILTTGTSFKNKIDMPKLVSIVKTKSLQPAKFKSTTEGDFDFAANVGTYTWNASVQKWEATYGVPSDKIIINFPSEETGTVNNCNLIIYDYQERAFQDEWGVWYEPVRIDAELSVDDVKQADLDVTITWNESETPVAIDLSLYLNPFDLVFNYTDGNTSLTANGSISKGTTTIISIGGTLEFMDALKEDPKFMDGFVQYNDLKMKIVVDFESLMTLADDEITAQQINDRISVDLYSYPDDFKMGYLEAFYDNYGDIDVRIVFNDESTVLASVYYEPIIESIDDFFYENFPDVK